jgi:hypothetical protein
MNFDFFKRPKQNTAPSVVANVDVVDYAADPSEYTFVFGNSSTVKVETYSFGETSNNNLSDTLIVYRNGEPWTKICLSYGRKTWDRKVAIKFGRFIAVGLVGFFYLYDLSIKRITLFIDFNGYFEDFKITKDYLLVVYHSGIYCLTQYGLIKWHNSEIGLDGIIIHEIKEGKLFGSEQVDPPDGWRDFIVELETGLVIP